MSKYNYISCSFTHLLVLHFMSDIHINYYNLIFFVILILGILVIVVVVAYLQDIVINKPAVYVHLVPQYNEIRDLRDHDF
jgi:Ni/Fe-hydrogenase subunit HybB-like protein